LAQEEGPIVSGIAGRYASALFDLAVEAGAVDAVGADLQRLDQMITESADLERLVRNPVFTAGEQRIGITAILDKAGIGGLAANFIKLLAAKRRLFVVRDCIRAFASLTDVRNGVVRAEVTVAETLSDKNREALIAALRGTVGKDVEFAEKVDPAIIGGIVVKLGSRMVDASVRTKLNSLKVAMKEVG
jgi:F-type H+-transporting ATPase subunit delta